jgi:hypothetical protein
VNRSAGYNQSQALFYLPCDPDETFDFLVRNLLDALPDVKEQGGSMP